MCFRKSELRMTKNIDTTSIMMATKKVYVPVIGPLTDMTRHVDVTKSIVSWSGVCVPFPGYWSFDPLWSRNMPGSQSQCEYNII